MFSFDVGKTKVASTKITFAPVLLEMASKVPLSCGFSIPACINFSIMVENICFLCLPLKA